MFIRYFLRKIEHRIRQCTYIALFFVVLFAPSAGVFSQQFVEIQDVKVVVSGVSARIEFRTNRPTAARVEYGLTEAYDSGLGSSGSMNQTAHSFYLSNLKSESTYHFRVVATANTETVSTFDRSFKTGKSVDRDMPVISGVHVAYTTGTTATIQWQTNEAASSHVRYGKTSKYTSSRSNGSRVTAHEITLTRLAPATRYHFQVSSKDKDNNTSIYSDLDFVTLQTNEAEKMPLTLTEVRPIMTTDQYVSYDAIVVSWRTNKLASATVRFGDSTRLRQTVRAAGLRSFEHQVPILKLKPGTRYYFQIESKDTLGKTAKSDVFTVVTKATPTTGGISYTPIVQGYSTVDLTLASKAVRVRGSSDVYVILKGQRYLVQRADDVSWYGISANKIQTVLQKELEQYPLVRLVRSPLSGRVYYLYRRDAGKVMKLHIPTPAIFSSYANNRWGDVVNVLESDIDHYRSVRVVKAAGSATVYDIQRGERRPFLSAAVFTSRGFAQSDIAEINTFHLAWYPLGEPVR